MKSRKNTNDMTGAHPSGIAQQLATQQSLLQAAMALQQIDSTVALQSFIKTGYQSIIRYTDAHIFIYNEASNSYVHIIHPELKHTAGALKNLSKAIANQTPLLISCKNDDALQQKRLYTLYASLLPANVQQILVLPFYLNDKIIGYACLFAEDAHAFADDKQVDFQIIQLQLAQATIRLLALSSHAAASFNSNYLLHNSEALANVKSKEELRKALQQLKSCLSFQDTVIIKLEENDSIFTVFLHDCEPERSRQQAFDNLVNSVHTTNEKLCTAVINSAQPIVFDIQTLVEEGSHLGFNFMQEHGIQEVICMRLRRGNESWGIWMLMSEEKGAFTLSSQLLIQQLSYQIANVSSDLFSQEMFLSREAEQLLLLGISNEIGKIRGKKDLQGIMQKTKQVLPFNEVMIGVYNPTKTTFQVWAIAADDIHTTKPGFEEIAYAEYPVNNGIQDVLLQASTPQVFYIENLVMKNAGQSSCIPYVFELGIREIAAMPLLASNNDVIGFITLLSTNRGAFRNKDLRLLEGIGTQLSVALSNVLTNEKIEQQLEEINEYKEKLEEEKSYLQEAVTGGYTYSDIIGSSAAMQHVFQMLSQVSFAESTVLVLGETGTGKELVARAIHNSSPRKDNLMVKVNCAALPPYLIESELFGHEKGAFTGAVERRIGKFELANGGTLFLDEIGEMPIDLQVKLLRAIQEREFERVGGKSTIKADVRIIAATNRNLQQEVAAGNFRSDLFYRLHVFPITLPSLRERKEDIPLLAAHFIARFAKNAGKQDIRIAATVMKQMITYDWPGNVRELEHVLERSVLLCQGNTIKSMQLDQRDARSKSNTEINFTRSLEEVEREYILGVLHHCKGKVFGPGGAAEILGMHVSTLNHRMKKLGIHKTNVFTIQQAN